MLDDPRQEKGQHVPAATTFVFIAVDPEGCLDVKRKKQMLYVITARITAMPCTANLHFYSPSNK